MKQITLKTGLAKKLDSLVFFLNRSESRLEEVADEVEDVKLKTALNGWAIESSQFAQEISLQLKCHGICMDYPLKEFDIYDLPDEAYEPETVELRKGGELALFCDRIERTITKAYRDLLEELYLPIPTLKELLHIQLNSLRNTFLRVKIINKTRFAT